MTKQELGCVLGNHKIWVLGKEGGSCANLTRANLTGANLTDVKMAWTSHDLVAEVLRRAAGDNITRLQVAGLVLIQRDWCWREFLAVDVPEKEWALDELAKWVQIDDDAPKVLRNREVAAQTKEV